MTRHVHLAFLWYRSAARKGDASAMQRIARCYADGIGCTADPALAKAWTDYAEAIRRHGRERGGGPPPPCPEG